MFPLVLICVAYFCFPTVLASKNCTTPNGEEATCISIYACQGLLEVAIGADNDTIQFLEKSACGCNLICCGTLTKYDVKSTTPVTDITSFPPNWQPLPSRRICGMQHSDYRLTDTISNRTEIDEFPWMVQIMYKDHGGDGNGTINSKCAGSLISRRYVLTAAQCVRNNNIDWDAISVRLGEHDTLKDIDCQGNLDVLECADPVVDAGIEKIIIHPDYKNHNNDVALIRMNVNVLFSDFVRPICLPSFGYGNATVGDTLYSSGWGAITFGEIEQSAVKKRGKSKVTSTEICEKATKTRRIKMNETVLCSISETMESSCHGDGGGPMMTQHNFQWQQDGIISFGRGCGIGAIEGNMRLSTYMDWIIQNIEP